jgi:hypothetical protein
MKTPTFFIATVTLFAAAGIAIAGEAANSSARLDSREEQIHLAPATHQPAAATKTAGSFIGNNESRKPAPQRVAPLSSSVAKPALPVDAGRQHGVAIIGGAAGKTSRENGVINGTERRHFP